MILTPLACSIYIVPQQNSYTSIGQFIHTLVQPNLLTQTVIHSNNAEACCQ